MKAVHLFLAISLSLWAQEPESQARLEYIEACSCDLFCPCFFNDHSSHQGSGAHMCTFNNVARISRGRHGATNLTGVKVWLSGDLGSDWATKGQAGWLVATFEPSATKEQKDGVMAILTKVYPVKWNSVQMDTSEITWSISPDGKSAHAKLANGKGEVKLTRFAGSDPSRPATLNNVRYFGAVWNSPFTMYHSEHYYKGFGKSYSLKKANGFTVSVEHSSDGKRVPAPAKKGD